MFVLAIILFPFCLLGELMKMNGREEDEQIFVLACKDNSEQ